MNIKPAFWGLITSFVVSTIFLKLFIPFLKKQKAGQQILCYVKEHSQKSGTPTMGGVCFLVVSIVISLIFFKGQKTLALLALAVYLAYGVTGFLDDFIKIYFKRNLGLRAY